MKRDQCAEVAHKKDMIKNYGEKLLRVNHQRDDGRYVLEFVKPNELQRAPPYDAGIHTPVTGKPPRYVDNGSLLVPGEKIVYHEDGTNEDLLYTAPGTRLTVELGRQK